MQAAAIDAVINALAADQFALVSHVQLLACGVSHRAIERRLHTGRLLLVRPGLYRLPAIAPSPQQRAMGFCLTAGRGALLSHRYAAMLWELDGFNRAPFEVVVPRWARRQRQTGLIVHESLDLRPIDATSRQGLPCTSAVRTLLDLGAVTSIERVESALESALRRRICTTDQILNRFVQVARRGRRGVGKLRTLLETRAGHYVPTGSAFELMLLRLLVDAGFAEPLKQVPVDLGDVTVYLDFAWPELLLAIECDGFAYHADNVRLRWDDDRQNQLVLRGWLVLRFTWKQVTEQPERVIAQVRAAYARRQAEHRLELA
jgi:very-short-patch-repair endonuclease